jgi:ribonucleoside-diphosphate reductase alpha chain
LDKIDKITKDIRPIGLGTFGLADLLYKLKIPYNSQEGYEFINELYEQIKLYATIGSSDLAKEKGVYPKFHGSIWEEKKQIVRNSCLLSIAPTGSISFIANSSGGLEPNYALVMQRRTNEGDLYYIVNPVFEAELKKNDAYSQEILDQIYHNNGSVKGLDIIPNHIQDIFVTAYDIAPEEHLKVLGIIQNHVDLSCSKTINLSKDTTVDYIMDLYLNAWKQRIKGVTCYRDGCRENQVLSTGSTSTPENNQIETKYIKPKKRPKIVKAEIEEFNVGCGKLYISVGEVNDQPFETFTNLGTSGVCPGFSAGLSRMVSLALRSGIDPEDVIDQLTSVTCANCKGKKTDAKSCPDAYGKALRRKFKKIIKEQKQEEIKELISVDNVVLCPECGEQLKFSEGCNLCMNCGFSKCS